MKIDKKFDFNDILIIPEVITDIDSRYEGIHLPNRLPLITAPMDTVASLDNINLFHVCGISVALPRTIAKERFFQQYRTFRDNPVKDNTFVSYGLKDIMEEEQLSYGRIPYNSRICIDVANGHMSKIIKIAKDIKTHRPDIKIMAGNIANPDTYTYYAEANCVDFIRIGIGNGGGCLTTKQSGVGFPMASLIAETRAQKNRLLAFHSDMKLPAIVADGGMQDYVDVIKALALGADYVMIGSIFNKAIESAGKNYLYGIPISQEIAEYLFVKNFPVKKFFRGMSTKGAQRAMGKDKSEFRTSEGVVRYRKVEYTLLGWVTNFEHYLRNAMSYSNASTLEEFIGCVQLCQITDKGYARFNK